MNILELWIGRHHEDYKGFLVDFIDRDKIIHVTEPFEAFGDAINDAISYAFSRGYSVKVHQGERGRISKPLDNTKVLH